MASIKSSKQKFNITKEELEKLVYTERISYTKIGKKYGVSDTAIRKRSLKLGVPIRKRGM